jgi:Glycosyl hydrolase family 3 C-terminal domain
VRRDDMPFGRAVGEVRAEGLTRLAVVGRLADVPNLGDHRSSDVRASWVVTALAGPRDALPTIEVTHTDGSDLVAAVADASAADAAVVVVGHTAEDEGEHVGSFDPELATLDPPSEDPQALDGHPPPVVYVLHHRGRLATRARRQAGRARPLADRAGGVGRPAPVGRATSPMTALMREVTT